MSDNATKIFSHSAIYAIGIILRNISSVIMLPIYTRHLKPADYGTIELLGMVVDFVGIFIALQIGQSVFRFYGLSETVAQRNRVINSAMLILVIMNAVGILLLYLLAPIISPIVFGKAGYEQLIRLFSLTMLFSALSEVPMVFIRAQQRPWLFVIFSALKLSMQVSFNVWFVVFRQMGVEGFIFSTLISGFIYSSILCAYTFYHTGFSTSLASVKSLAVFSFPLMLGTMATFYMTSIDKYSLSHFSSLSSVGLYSLAYKFGFLLTAGIGMPFLAVWEPMRFKIYQDVNARRQFDNVLRIYTLILAFAWLGISLLSKEVLKIMSSPEFWGAATLVPWMVMAYLFHCWTEFGNFGLMLSGKTFHVAIASFLGGLVMTVGCLLFIPSYGALGASVTACAAFFVRFFWIYRMGQRYYKVSYSWASCILVLAIAIVEYLVSLLLADDVLIALVEKVGLLGLFLAIVWFTPIAKDADRDFVKASLNRLFRREMIPR